MYHVEDRHWWYRGMETITRALLERWIPLRSPKILDAGCGTGAAMTTYLAEYGMVTGIDLYAEALRFCRKRNAPRLARASVLDLPFEDACLRFYENDRAVRTASSEQVRQPIFRDAMDHWRHYEPWLDPLTAALGPVLDAYPAAPPLP